ncbi:MAG: hypothetical protein J1E98_12500 [Lachnospiraceae bacterium]|nr:hypothetical protein [Lachnospiraceae bacterium]
MKKGKTVIILLISILILMCGCTRTSNASEAMQTSVADIDLQDDLLFYGSTVEYILGSIDKEYLESDDELNEELALRLLKSRNIDTSVLENTEISGSCTFTLPKGFEESEDITGMYLNEHYPIDASTIYYKELDKDMSLQLMSENTFRQNMEKELEKIYDYNVKLNIETFEQIKINDFASFKIRFSYTNDDVEFTQLQYIINADKTYVITYSQTDEYDRMDEFEESAETIQITF